MWEVKSSRCPSSDPKWHCLQISRFDHDMPRVNSRKCGKDFLLSRDLGSVVSTGEPGVIESISRSLKQAKSRSQPKRLGTTDYRGEGGKT